MAGMLPISLTLFLKRRHLSVRRLLSGPLGGALHLAIGKLLPIAIECLVPSMNESELPRRRFLMHELDVRTSGVPERSPEFPTSRRPLRQTTYSADTPHPHHKAHG